MLINMIVSHLSEEQRQKLISTPATAHVSSVKFPQTNDWGDIAVAFLTLRKLFLGSEIHPNDSHTDLSAPLSYRSRFPTTIGSSTSTYQLNSPVAAYRLGMVDESEAALIQDVDNAASTPTQSMSLDAKLNSLSIDDRTPISRSSLHALNPQSSGPITSIAEEEMSVVDDHMISDTDGDDLLMAPETLRLDPMAHIISRPPNVPGINLLFESYDSEMATPSTHRSLLTAALGRESSIDPGSVEDQD